MTAMQMLVKQGGAGGQQFKEDALNILLERNADVAEMHPKSGNALHIAVGAAATSAVSMLLSAGAPRNVPNSRGQWPLDCLGQSRGIPTYLRVLEMLETAACKRNPHWDGLPGRVTDPPPACACQAGDASLPPMGQHP